MPIPIAPKEPTEFINHGRKRVDHFAWLKDREDPRTIPYLQEENQYSEEIMAEHASVRKELYDEMLERIVEDDQTVPYLLGDWWHYSRTAKGKANWFLHGRVARWLYRIY